jgi:nucleotide-binding universal stress UspA family protein
MSQGETTFHRVIVGIDGRAGGRDAIALARILSGRQTRLTLAHVHPGAPAQPGAASGDASSHSAADKEAEALLERQRAEAELEAELAPVGASSIGRGLDQLAEREDADLIVVGSSHRGFLGRVFIGDDTRDALNGAPCAIAVAPVAYAQGMASMSAIGVGDDDSPEGEAALQISRRLAREHGGGVRALRIVQIITSGYAGFGGVAWGEALEKVLAETKESMGAIEGVEGDAVLGIPGEELAAFGEHVDLLVVGSRAYGPVRRLMLGSTSHYLVGHARCPLLVIPRPSA